jgi:hypothetical protein
MLLMDRMAIKQNTEKCGEANKQLSYLFIVKYGVLVVIRPI